MTTNVHLFNYSIPSDFLNLLSQEARTIIFRDAQAWDETRLRCCKIFLKEIMGEEFDFKHPEEIKQILISRNLFLNEGAIKDVYMQNTALSAGFPGLTFEHIKGYFLVAPLAPAAPSSSSVIPEVERKVPTPEFQNSRIKLDTPLEYIHPSGFYNVGDYIVEAKAKIIAKKITPKILPRKLEQTNSLYKVVEHSKMTRPRQVTVGHLITAIQEAYAQNPNELDEIMSVMGKKFDLMGTD